MDIQSILIPITLFALLIASYTDIKHREVADWINYGLIFAALGIRSIVSVEQGWSILLSGLLGLGVCYGLAATLYYTNQWGGGDSKLLMAMGAVIGIEYPFTAASLHLGGYLMGLLVLGAAYGLLWMGFLAIQNTKLFWRKTKLFIGRYSPLHTVILIYTAFFVIISIKFAFFWPITIFPMSVFYLIAFMNTMEDTLFLKKKDINELTEGDWLAEDVTVSGKVMLTKRTLEMKDLNTLQRLRREKKIAWVTIKEGIPFVPSFLLAYLVYLGGSAVWELVWKVLF